MLANVGGHNLAMLRRGIVENPLNKVVSVLVARNIDQRDASAVSSTFAHAVQVASKELAPSNLEAFLHHFGSELVGAVFGCVSDNMVDGSAAVRRTSVFADVLDAPISKLAVGNNVNVGEHFFNAWTLQTG